MMLAPMPARRLLVLLAMGGFVGAVLAQPQQAGRPQFRSGVDLVHLDVSVLDKDRRPVRGLTAADFSVFEVGRPHTIAAFSAVDLPDREPPTTPWMRDVAPDVRSNTTIADHRLIVIVMDDATIPFDLPMIKSAKEIGRLAVERLGANDLACVVFTRDNRNAQEFTSDRTRLLKAIDSFEFGGRTIGLPPNPPPGFQLAESNAFYQSIGTLSRVAEALADVPERRKAVVYVTVGLPADPETASTPVLAGGTGDDFLGGGEIGPMLRRIFDYMSETYRRAQAANVNIYTVSPAGVGGMDDYIQSQRWQGRFVPPYETGFNYSEFLIGIAENTGGRAFTNRNEFDSALTTIFQENGSYYLLGYQPPNPALDGRFRRIEVKVNRPGVTIRTRSGYYNAKEKVEKSAAAAPLTSALSGLLPKTEVPLEVMAAPFAIPGKVEAGVAVVLTVHEDLPARSSRTTEDVDLQISAFTQEGVQKASERLNTKVTLRAGPAGPAEFEVLSKIALRPGRYQLRLAAVIGGRAGSVYYDIDIPDFGAKSLSISGLVLSSEPRPVSSPTDPIKSLMPIAPTARRTFGASDKVTAFARIYQGGRDPVAATTVTIKITDAAGALRLNRTQLVTAGGESPMGRGGRQGSAPVADVPAADRSIDFRMDLPLTSLPDGEYLLTLDAATSRGVAQRHVRFIVK
jgi:VWFA-related protein